MGYNAATVALVAVSLGTRPEDWWKSATRSVIFSSSTNVLVAANAIFAALLNLALVLKAVFFGALGNQVRHPPPSKRASAPRPSHSLS